MEKKSKHSKYTDILFMNVHTKEKKTDQALKN